MVKASLTIGGGFTAFLPRLLEAIHWGTGVPDGNTPPFSDMLKGSFYIQTDATDDTSVVWQKVDESSANDDWVKFMVDKSEEGYTIEADWTWDVDKKIQLRDTGIFLHSNAAGYMHLQATTGVTVGDGTNQAAFASDGTVSLEGTAKVTERVSFPIDAGGGTADTEIFNGAPSINLDNDLETFAFALRVPEAWDGISDITVFFDVGNEIAEDDGDDVSFTLQVRGYADGETMSDAGQAPAGLQDLTGGDQAINVINRVTATIDYDDATYPIVANDTLVIECTVNLAGAGECTGPLHIIAWGIEYVADKLGE